jgi:Secretion system C-terminal sorting domain
MKKILTLLSLFCGITAQAQLLFIDSFLYAPSSVLAGNGGWIQSTATTVNATSLQGNGLIYPNYSNATSGCAEIYHNGGNGDVTYNSFAQQNSGSVYASFVINVSVAPSTSSNPYCITIGNQANFAYAARLLVKKSATANFVNLGTRKAGGADVYSTIDYPLNSSHLVILKYVFNSGSATDDVVKMYVNPINLVSEPAAAQADASMGADFMDVIKHFVFRNNGGTNIPTAKIDEVHVGKTWADIFTPVVIVPDGIYDNSTMAQLNIIPNPAKNTIYFDGNLNAKKVMITDIFGRLVLNQNFKTEISISQLTNGLYQVVLFDEQKNIIGTSKLIKQD